MLNTFRVIFVDYDGNIINPDVEGCDYSQTGDDVYFSFDWGNPVDLQTPRDFAGTGIAGEYAYDNRTLNDMFRKYAPFKPFIRTTEYLNQGVNPPGENPLPTGSPNNQANVRAGRTGELLASSLYNPITTLADGTTLSSLQSFSDRGFRDFSRDRGVTMDMRVPSFFFKDSNRSVANTKTDIVDYGNDELLDSGVYDVKITQTPTDSGIQDNEIDVSEETDFPRWIYIGLVGAGGPAGCKLAGVGTVGEEGGDGGDCPNPPCPDTNITGCLGGDGNDTILCLCPKFEYNWFIGVPGGFSNFEAFSENNTTQWACEGAPAVATKQPLVGEDGIQGGVFLRTCGNENEDGERTNIVVRIKSLGKGGIETFDAQKRPGNPFSADDEAAFKLINRNKTVFPVREDRNTEVEVYAVPDGTQTINDSNRLLTMKADGGRARPMVNIIAPQRKCGGLIETWCRMCGDQYNVSDDAVDRECINGFGAFTDFVDEVFDDESSPPSIGPSFLVQEGPAFDSTKYEYIKTPEQGFSRQDDKQVAFPDQFADPDIGIVTRRDWYKTTGKIQSTPQEITLKVSGSFTIEGIEPSGFTVEDTSTGLVTPLRDYTLFGDTKYVFIQDDSISPLLINDGYDQIPAGDGGEPGGDGIVDDTFDKATKYFIDGVVVTKQVYFDQFHEQSPESTKEIVFRAPENISASFVQFDSLLETDSGTNYERIYVSYVRSPETMIPNPGLGGLWNAWMMTNGLTPPRNEFSEGAAGNGGAVYFSMGQMVNGAAEGNYKPPDEEEPPDPDDGGDVVDPPDDPANIATLQSGIGFDSVTPEMDPENIYSDDPSQDPYSYTDTDGSLRQSGENAVAIARWTKIPDVQRRSDFYITVSAEHIRGIKRVELSLNGGPWQALDAKQGHPTDLPESKTIGLGKLSQVQSRENGYKEYIARVNIEGIPSELKQKSEIRARVIPNVGIPLILQGDNLTQYDELRNVECGICRYGYYQQERDPDASDPTATYEVFKPFYHKRRFGTEYEISPWYDEISNYEGTENINVHDGFEGFTPQEVSDYRQSLYSYDDVPGGLTFGYFPQDYRPDPIRTTGEKWLYETKEDCINFNGDNPQGNSVQWTSELFYEELPEGEDVYVKGQKGNIVPWPFEGVSNPDTEFLRASNEEAQDSLLYCPGLETVRDTNQYFRDTEIYDNILNGLCSFMFNCSDDQFEYYVDSKYGSNDTGIGTYEQPYRTISKVIDENKVSLRNNGGVITLKGTSDDPRTYRCVGDSGVGSNGEPLPPFSKGFNLDADDSTQETTETVVIEGEEQGGVFIAAPRQGLDKTLESTFLSAGNYVKLVVKNVTIKLQQMQKLYAPVVVAVNSDGIAAQSKEEITGFIHSNEYYWDSSYTGVYDYTAKGVSARVFSGPRNASIALVDCYITPDDSSPEITEAKYWSNYDWNNPGDYIVSNVDEPPGSEGFVGDFDPTISNGYGPTEVPFPKKGDKIFFGAIMDVSGIFQDVDDTGDTGLAPRPESNDPDAPARKGPIIDLRSVLLPEGSNSAAGLEWEGVELAQDYNAGGPWRLDQAWRYAAWQRVISANNFSQSLITYNCEFYMASKGLDAVYLSKHDSFDRIHWDQYSGNPGSVFNLYAERHDTSGDFTSIHGDFLQTFDFSGNPLTREAILENRMFDDILIANSKLQLANFEGNKLTLPNMHQYRHWIGAPTNNFGTPINPLEATVATTKGSGSNVYLDIFKNWSFCRWTIDNHNSRTGGINYGCFFDHFVNEDQLLIGCSPGFAAMSDDWKTGRRDYVPFKNVLLRNYLTYQIKGNEAGKIAYPFDGNTVDSRGVFKKLSAYPYPTHVTPFQDLRSDVETEIGNYRRVGWVADDGTDYCADKNLIVENIYTQKPNDSNTVVSEQDMEFWRPTMRQEMTKYRRPDGNIADLPPSFFDLNTNSGGEPSCQPTKNNPEYSHYCETIAEYEAQLFEGCSGPFGVTEEDILANIDVGPNGDPAPGGIGVPSGGNFYWGGGFSEYAWLTNVNEGFKYGVWGKYTGFRGVCCPRLIDRDDIDNDGNTFEEVDVPETEHWGPFDSGYFSGWTCKPYYYYDTNQLDLRNRNRSRTSDEYPNGTPLLDGWPRGNNNTDWSERP
tara:strand:- start:481 stop:6825 length:6345 start_codon:yes stop_codon:yes gene_type:complete